jgi:hypothetical protein
MFADLSGMEQLGRESQDFCNQIKSYEEELFRNWIESIKKALQDPNQK